jgi:hypothetical protein
MSKAFTIILVINENVDLLKEEIPDGTASKGEKTQTDPVGCFIFHTISIKEPLGLIKLQRPNPSNSSDILSLLLDHGIIELRGCLKLPVTNQVILKEFVEIIFAHPGN